MTPDVLVLTEHGLNKNKLKETRLEGYVLMESFSREHHLKGGTAIYVSEDLAGNTTSLNIADCSTELVCEIAGVKITKNKTDYHIIGVYRREDDLTTAMDTLSNALEKIPVWKSPVIVMGDVNIDCLNTGPKQSVLNDTLASYNITRLNLPPTRITDHSSTSIDMICTNQLDYKIRATVIQTYISDHTGQLCSIYENKKFQPTTMLTEGRQFSNRNILLLKHLLQKETWEDVNRQESVESTYNCFIETLLYNLNIACPNIRKQTKTKQKPKIYDHELKLKRHSFLKANEAYTLTGSKQNKIDANIKKKEYDLHLKNLRKQRTADFINDSDNKSKAMWKLINKERSNNSSGKELHKLNINGRTIEEPDKITDHLNSYFVNIANNTLANLKRAIVKVPHKIVNSVPGSLFFWPTNKSEVSKIIKSMKTKHSAGPDEISPAIVKICEDELVLPLVNIINKSLEQGTFPSKLKLARVYPKLKNGDSTDQGNYRPISLLSTFSKILERIVLTRLLHHFSINNIQMKGQHGFTEGHSTTTAIASLVEFIIQATEEGNTTSAIFLDYSKAFDCISHEMLLSKLDKMGVRGITANWFKSYLQGRNQTVEITRTVDGVKKKFKSKPLPIQRGVPQGSVLGPVLYIIFVNDLPDYINTLCSTLMYADDTVLLLRNRSPTHMEVESYIAVSMAQQYCERNDLILNEKKSQQLVIGRAKEDLCPLPDLEQVGKVKYLGVIIDSKLTWTDHINNLCCKLSSALYVLRRLTHVCNHDIARTAYFAIFESYLRYGLVVWGGTSKANLQRVLVYQKRAVRILTGLGPRDSCREAFKEQKILTVIDLYILETTLFALRQNPTRGNETHNYNTRTANNFALPTHRLTRFEKQPTYAGSNFWNILPEEVKKGKLSKTISRWLLDRPYYTVEEFKNWRRDPQPWTD